MNTQKFENNLFELEVKTENGESLFNAETVARSLGFVDQQVWKTQKWPQDWKRSVFISIPKKSKPKNAQTTTQLHSSHTLVK